MIRLHFTVEGQTEQAFVHDLLKEHLAHHNVFVSNPRLTALCKKKGTVHRGGLKTYQPAKNDIRRWLKQDRAAEARFTTMIDLYALPKDFPGYNEASQLSKPCERVELLEKSFAEDIGDPRFIPYIQLHEFEALLLVEPEKFRDYYSELRYANGVEELAKEIGRLGPPEEIDDGERTAPSKRIGKHLPAYLRTKPQAGPLVAERIGLDKIRGACPHFDQWLKTLENLAGLSPQTFGGRELRAIQIHEDDQRT